jgi:UDPglucose 6-dehydrogenase
VIATEWEQFRALDLDRLKRVMVRPVIVDLRNIYRADEMKRANFRYLAVGRAGVDFQPPVLFPKRTPSRRLAKAG